jgi:hypothetical protein
LFINYWCVCSSWLCVVANVFNVYLFVRNHIVCFVVNFLMCVLFVYVYFKCFNYFIVYLNCLFKLFINYWCVCSACLCVVASVFNVYLFVCNHLVCFVVNFLMCVCCLCMFILNVLILYCLFKLFINYWCVCSSWLYGVASFPNVYLLVRNHLVCFVVNFLMYVLFVYVYLYVWILLLFI